MNMIKRLVKKALGIKPPPAQRTPAPILIERDILMRALAHLEGRRQTWKERGAAKEFKIGQYFEFGCYNGDSLLDFHNALNIQYNRQLPDYWQFYVFDSFEGLPPTEDKADLHPFAGEGSYRSKGAKFVKRRLVENSCPEERLHFHKGFFEDSLTPELREQLIERGVFASYVNIDCDYHSSTITVLNWLEPLLTDGSLLYFDDIYFYNGHPDKGQIKSIREFNEKREHSGLAPAPWFDQGHRCYLYWREEELGPRQFQFEKYVVG
jgi:hypothetical protein